VIIRKRFTTPLTFPVEVDEEWKVRDGSGRIVEHWRVIASARLGGSFTAEINIVVPQD
jgi:hypothetical protein